MRDLWKRSASASLFAFFTHHFKTKYEFQKALANSVEIHLVSVFLML